MPWFQLIEWPWLQLCFRYQWYCVWPWLLLCSHDESYLTALGLELNAYPSTRISIFKYTTIFSVTKNNPYFLSKYLKIILCKFCLSDNCTPDSLTHFASNSTFTLLILQQTLITPSWLYLQLVSVTSCLWAWLAQLLHKYMASHSAQSKWAMAVNREMKMLRSFPQS